MEEIAQREGKTPKNDNTHTQPNKKEGERAPRKAEKDVKILPGIALRDQ